MAIQRNSSDQSGGELTSNWHARCLVALIGGWLLASAAHAASRDYVLAWQPPTGTVTGYRVHLGSAPRTYGEVIDLGSVPADSDGIGRSTLTLDAARDYYISLTAYNTTGESPYSNEIRVAASQCDPSACDDGLDCTADDCTAAGCVHTTIPDGTFCSDGGAAYGMCMAGTCQEMTPAGSEPPISGLVAAWGLDEGAGTSAADASGYGNTGTLTNGPIWAAGKFGKSVQFDGSNDVIVVPDAGVLDLSTGMTIEAWVRPTVALTYWKAIVQKEVDAYHLMASTDANRPAVGGTFNGSCCTMLNGPAGLAVNTWTHVAGTYDGANLRLYVNGTLVSTQARAGALQVNALPLRIGGNSYLGEFFTGQIDEVRIYNRALSASEVIRDMSTPVGGTSVSATPTGGSTGTPTPDPTPADTTPPVRSNGAPSGALAAGTSQATLTLRTDEAATCRYGTTPGAAYSSLPTPFSTTGGTSHARTVSGLVNGQAYTYVVRCQDAAGNANSTDFAISFSVASPSDTTPPTAAITAPASGATLSGLVTVSATASDDSGVVAGVQFLLDGSPLGVEDTTTPYSVLWDTNTVSAGNHVLTARARDRSSNVRSSPSVTVTVSKLATSTNGLVAAWGMNEGTGSTVADASGNRNTGTLTNGPSFVAGKYGKSVQFDGWNDVIVVRDSSSLDLSTAMTIEAWVRPTRTLSWWKAIVQKQADGYHLMASTDANRPAVGGTFDGSCCTMLNAPAQLPVNQWTHIAGTYDGSNLRLYVNGALVGTRSRRGTLQVNGLPLRIGGNSYPSEFFKGQIDEVRIYNRALSASEIQRDMATPVSAP